MSVCLSQRGPGMLAAEKVRLFTLSLQKNYFDSDDKRHLLVIPEIWQNCPQELFFAVQLVLWSMMFAVTL